MLNINLFKKKEKCYANILKENNYNDLFIIEINSKNFIKFVLFIIFNIIIYISFFLKFNNLKIALCTMGRKENLYVKEFISYYIKLGINKIFIYDDNELNDEKIKNVINPFNNFIQVYENIKNKIKNQPEAFNDCYKNNKNKFNWFLMVDMDEYLVIVNNTLKNYLLNPIFNKCDFIKFHWVIPSDNNLIYYDNRSLFERFKGPYKKSIFIKSLIRGNINNLKYQIHSPSFSPHRNTTCNNIGKIITYKNINFQTIYPINIEKAYIIHYRYKSTEEFINKIKRGYSDWFKDNAKSWLFKRIRHYIRDNIMTKRKINYLEKELNINLTKCKKRLKK